MKRWIRILGALLLLSVAATLAPTLPVAHAAEPPAVPPSADAPGYSLRYSLSADPTDLTYTASYTPDVKAIYAFVLVSADNGAAEKQFQVDVQFVTPNGKTIPGKWYQNDTGAVTTISDTALKSGQNLSSKNVARKQLDIAGTDNAKLTGAWKINFRVGGKTVLVGDFTLATPSDVSDSDAVASAQSDLEQAGYTVDTFDSTTLDDGTVVALVAMPMISQQLYSSEISKQIVDGYAALRKAFAQTDYMMTSLEYNDQYDIVVIVKTPDWDKYASSKDFATLSRALAMKVFDKDANAYVDNSKDFITKNFGAGKQAPPVGSSSTGNNTSQVGSIKIDVAPSSVPADGTSTAQVNVTVYDKRNKPLANQNITFDVSGTGAGTVRPKATTTDSKGAATATFTAGKKAGTVTLKATVGKDSNTAVITVTTPGQDDNGGTDPVADSITAYLTSKGYNVSKVAYDQTQKLAAVQMDLGGPWDTTKLPTAILYGMAALRDGYPDATGLLVLIPYQNTYVVVFGAPVADFDKLMSALQAAGNDKTAISKALNTFFTPLFDRAVVMDSSGNVVSKYKDFANKNFGGG